MFISTSPGETLFLKYNYTAKHANWYVPGHDETKSRIEEVTDMYGQMKKWHIRLYSLNKKTNNFTNTNRLKIVGNVSGEFFLQIANITKDDVGLYRCDIITGDNEEDGEKAMHFTNLFIVQLKCKYISRI